MPPSAENEYGMAKYVVPAVVAYRQVAFTFETTESVAEVVEALSVPVGEPEESTGPGLMAGGALVPEIAAERAVDNG